MDNHLVTPTVSAAEWDNCATPCLFTCLRLLYLPIGIRETFTTFDWRVHRVWTSSNDSLPAVLWHSNYTSFTTASSSPPNVYVVSVLQSLFVTKCCWSNNLWLQNVQRVWHGTGSLETATAASPMFDSDKQLLELFKGSQNEDQGTVPRFEDDEPWYWKHTKR